MISKLKKNSIDLYKLKTPKDLSHVENYFDLFLKKNFFKENKINKKFIFIKNKCLCGSKKFIHKKKN